MIYLQFARFLLPLALTLIVQGFSGQFLSGGMARLPQATLVLAAYGVAWGLVDFLASPLSQVGQLGLVLATSHPARRQLQVFVLGSGGALAGALALLALSPLGDWVIYQGHGLSPEVGQMVVQALCWLAPVPVLEGLNRFCAGLLMRVRRTEVVSYATLASIGASIGAVFVLLPAPLVQAQPIRLPLLVSYTGIGVHLGVLLWGYRRYVAPALGPEQGEGLSLGYVLHFFWPLALVMAFQGLSRPLINFFVARGPDGPEALAVLAVVYPLAQLPYGWVNELRSLVPAFQGEGHCRPLRCFAVLCGALSFGIMAGMFWTPLRHPILTGLLGLDPGLAARCQWPLFWFSFFPLAVALRAYSHGVALVEHRTRALAPSAPSRIGIIWLALLALPTEVHGATRGVAALLCGFVLEAAVVWWGVRRWSAFKAERRRG